MEVSVKNSGELGRKLQITLPAEEVEKSFNKRLQKTSRKMRIPGFRPGKVPPKLLKDLHGEALFQEMAAEMMEKAYKDAAIQHQIKVVGSPKFEDIKLAMGEDIEFVAKVEVFPEFQPALLSGVEIVQPHAEVSAEDVENFLLKIRREHGEWLSVERAIQQGDRAEIRLHSAVAAVEFGKKKDEIITLLVGEANVKGDFNEKLIGCSKGQQATIRMQVSYNPQGKFQKLLRKIKLTKETKSEIFQVTVEKVEESKPAEMDAAFFEGLGVKQGGVEKLKEVLREGMEQRLQQNIRQQVQNKVIDALIEKNPITIPQVLVENEIEALRKNMAMSMGLDDEKAKELESNLFRERAEYNVKLFLIVDKIAEHQELTVDNDDFEAKLKELTAGYEDPGQAKNYYRRNQQARSSVRMMALQDQVFEYVLKTATLKEKKSTFSEMIGT